MIRAYLLRRDDPLSWSLMPEICDRIRHFVERVGGDAPAEVIIEALRVQFVCERPDLICIVGLDEQGSIAAHLVASIERWAGKTRATVLQLEIDRTVPPREMALGIRLLIGWARERGAEELQAFVANETIARLFRRRFGFEKKWIVVRRPVSLVSRAEGQFSAEREEQATALPVSAQNAKEQP